MTTADFGGRSTLGRGPSCKSVGDWAWPKKRPRAGRTLLSWDFSQDTKLTEAGASRRVDPSLSETENVPSRGAKLGAQNDQSVDGHREFCRPMTALHTGLFPITGRGRIRDDSDSGECWSLPKSRRRPNVRRRLQGRASTCRCQDKARSQPKPQKQSRGRRLTNIPCRQPFLLSTLQTPAE